MKLFVVQNFKTALRKIQFIITFSITNVGLKEAVFYLNASYNTATKSLQK